MTAFRDIAGDATTLPSDMLPALSISEKFSAVSQAAMLALTAQRGDICLRSDNNHIYWLTSDSPSTLADWLQIDTGTTGVTSINGETGVLTDYAKTTDLTAKQSTSAKDQANGYAGLDANAKLLTSELPTSLNTLTAALAGWYNPIGALSRWLYSASPKRTVLLALDSEGQDTVAHSDGFPQLLRQALAFQMGGASQSIVGGAGFYHLLRSGNQLGVGNSAFEWYFTGTWTGATSLASWDYGWINSSSVQWSSATAKRRVTDAVTTANSRTLTSATASFVAADVGCLINTANTAAGTFIAKVSSGTSVELSQPAVTTGSSVTLDIHGTCLIWMRPLSQQAGERYRFDASITSASATLTSATMSFSAYDIGASIAGPGIPGGTTITAVASATSITMSANATSTLTSSHVHVGPTGGRIVMDAVTTNASVIITSATAAFTSADLGRPVAGTNIPDGATIVQIDSATQMRISASCSAAVTGGTLRLGALLVDGSRGDVQVAELENLWVDLTTVGSGYTYSINGGATWVAASNAGSNPPILKSTVIAATNPTYFIVRAQSATTQNSASSATIQAGLLTRRLASATQGLQFYNASIDGHLLAQMVRGRTVSNGVTTNGSTTITSATAAFVNSAMSAGGDIGKKVRGVGIPAGATISSVTNSTTAVISAAATATGTGVQLAFMGTNGDNLALLNNTQGGFAGIKPDLMIVGMSNDLINSGSAVDPSGVGYCLYLSELKTRLDAISCDMGVYVTYEQGGVRTDGTQATSTIQANYRATIHAWCVTNGVAYFDGYDHLDGNGVTGFTAANAAGLMADTFHLSAKGGRVMGAAFRRGLMVLT